MEQVSILIIQIKESLPKSKMDTHNAETNCFVYTFLERSDLFPVSDMVISTYLHKVMFSKHNYCCISFHI